MQLCWSALTKNGYPSMFDSECSSTDCLSIKSIVVVFLLCRPCYSDCSLMTKMLGRCVNVKEKHL